MRKLWCVTCVVTLYILALALTLPGVTGLCAAQTAAGRVTMSQKPISAAAPAEVTPAPKNTTLPGGRTYSLFAPYYTVANGFMSMLMLNNATQSELSISIVLTTLDGEPASLPPVRLRARETKQVDLNEWVAGLGSRYATGSVRLDYEGIAYAIGAMVMMVNEPESVELDVLAHPAFEFKSNRLEAVWWLPDPTAEVRFAVRNTTNAPLKSKLTLTASDGHPVHSATLEMKPHQTRVYNLNDILDDEKRNSAGIGGISIEHAGKPGDLMAQCLILRRNKGFSASLQFEDPKNSAEARLEGAGILLGSEESVGRADLLSGRLLLRNISSGPVTVRPMLQRGASTHPLIEVSLNPGEAKEIPVLSPSTMKEPGNAGIAISYSGQPGDLLGYWFSVDRSGSLVVETPLRSPASVPQAGSNPWSLEGDYFSVLYVKNTSKVAGSFVADIFYKGGSYMIGMKTVEAGETAAIDIRVLRDNQTPDVFGRRLPIDIQQGQINWRTRPGSPRLIGRVNTMSVSKGLANNMSCSTCCSCPTDVSVSLAPASWTGTVGNTYAFTPWENDTDGCGNNTSYPISTSLLTWSSSNLTVATVDQSAVASCRAGGLATITGDGFFHNNIIDNSIDPTSSGCLFCTDNVTEQNASGDMKVLPKIDNLDPDIAMINANGVQIKINGSGFNGSTGNGVPTVNLPAGFTKTGQGNTNTRIVVTVNIGVTAAIGLNNLTVTTDIGQSNNGTFTVNGPHEMAVQSDVIGQTTNNPNARSRFVTYQVQNVDHTLLTSAIPIAEDITLTGYNCNQADPGNSTAHCDGTGNTNAIGEFTDEWGMYTGYTPAGCGKNITDHWQWCGPTAPAPNPGKTFGTLVGFVHTVDSKINGFTNPLTPIPQGTVFLP